MDVEHEAGASGEYRAPHEDPLLARASAAAPHRFQLTKRRCVALAGSLALVAACALLLAGFGDRGADDANMPRLGWDDWEPWQPWQPFKPMKPMKPMTMKPMTPFDDFDDFPPFEPFKPFKPFKFKPFKPMAPFSEEFDGAIPMPDLDSAGLPELGDVLPSDGRRLRWAIAGPTPIAHDFAAALHSMGGQLQAVAGADEADFASTYGIGSAYDSIESIADDGSVDAVYVGTSAKQQYATAKAMLRAGKHVLLEKPPTLTPDQFDELSQLAASKQRLFVINYWTRFFPAVTWAQNAVKSGKAGAVQHVRGVSPPGNLGSVLDMVHYAALLTAPEAQGEYDVRTKGHLSPGDGSSELAFQITHGGVDATFTMSDSTFADGFELQVLLARGAVKIGVPAQAPTGASYTVCRDTLPDPPPTPLCGSDVPVSQGQSQQSLPVYPRTLAASHAVLHGMGLVYVASAIERCAFTQGCSELIELTNAQQRLTVQLTADVLSQLMPSQSQS
jgi:hypothetical protein